MKVIPGEIHSDSNNSCKKNIFLTPIIHDPTYQSSLAMSSLFRNPRSVATERAERTQARVRNSIYNVNVEATTEDNLRSKILYDVHFQKSHKGEA